MGVPARVYHGLQRMARAGDGMLWRGYNTLLASDLTGYSAFLVLAYTLAYPRAFPGLAGPFWGLAGALLQACNAGACVGRRGMPVFTGQNHSTVRLYSMAWPSPG